MGAAVSIIASVAAVVIPAILSAIRGSKVEENPTMRAIEEQHRREEEERAEAQSPAEPAEPAEQLENTGQDLLTYKLTISQRCPF